MIAHPHGRRRHGRAPAALASLTLALLGAIGPASTAVASTTDDGIGSVTVEPADGLPVEGAEVVVRGTGFDPSAGIYVAVCVDNGPDEKPTPCIGGADTGGVGGATWISDDPPSYAEGLTVPYGPDGSFEVTLPVPVSDDVTGVDCRVDRCAVTVRFDHLRADDRRADHVVPVTFAEDAGIGAAEPGAAGGSADTEGDGVASAAGGDDIDATSPDAEPSPELATGTEAAVEPDGGASSAGVVALAAALAALAAAAVLLARRRRGRPAAGSADHGG